MGIVRRLSLLAALLLAMTSLAGAQRHLPTEDHYVTMRAHILGTPALDVAAAQHLHDVIADYYNAEASPDFWIWRNSIPSTEYRKVLVGSEVEALTSGKVTSFLWLTGNLTLPIDASDPTVQTTIASIFGGGTTSRANLIALAKRRATVAQKLFATGAGAIGNPATAAFYGTLSPRDIAHALDPTVPID